MDGLNEYAYLLILSVTSVLTLFVIAKLLGKKQIAQLDFVDYIIGISIGSIAAEMATDVSDKPIQYYIIAMAVFFIFGILISLIERKNPALKHLFRGRPMTIIYDGKVDYKVLNKSRLDMNDIIGMCREQGYFDISKIAFAILENSGQLSILPVAAQRPTVAGDFDKIPFQKSELPCYLVVDGRISFSSLNELGKDRDWLLSELKIASEKELKNIIIAYYDAEKKQVVADYKN